MNIFDQLYEKNAFDAKDINDFLESNQYKRLLPGLKESIILEILVRLMKDVKDEMRPSSVVE